MGIQLYSNNATGFLASGIALGATSLTLGTGQGAGFPSPTNGDWFLLTLVGVTAGAETSWEIVKCTARTADTLTIVRAQETTTAAAWATGTKAELRLTSGTFVPAVAGGQNGLLLGSDKTKLDALSGTNSGDETTATIKTKLGITTLSGSNTGDQVIPTASITAPAALGVAAVGVGTTFARADHVHLVPTLATLGAQAAGTYATGTGTASGTNTGDQTTISGNAGSATTLSAGADRTKLDGIAAGATAYSHPANHAPSIITQDASNRFVTDTEKSTWNGKQAAGTYATGTGTASGTNTGDETVARIGVLLNSATAKTTLIDSDTFGMIDNGVGGVLKQITWANTKAALVATALTWSATQSFAAINATTGTFSDVLKSTSTYGWQIGASSGVARVQHSAGVFSFINDVNQYANIQIAALGAGTGSFSGALSATTGSFSGALSATTGTFSSYLGATRLSSSSGIVDFDAMAGSNFLQLTGGDLNLYTGGTLKMVWKATSGNVGIGTTAPDATLHVSGHVHIGTQNAFDNPGSWNKSLLIDGTGHARIRLKASASTYAATEAYFWADASVVGTAGIYASNGFSLTVGGAATNFTFNTVNGWLKIGPLNTSWCHYDTSASGGHYFYQNIYGNGTITTVTGFVGPLTGNASTATTFSTTRANYKGTTDFAVAGELMWKNYGNSHTMIDASAGTAPNGAVIDRYNPTYPIGSGTGPSSWGQCVNLMGWNGSNTFGVKVDWARYSENSAAATTATNLSGGTVSGQLILTNDAYFRGSPGYGFRFNDNASAYNNFIIYENGNVWARGTVTGSNLSGTNTGDQTNISGSSVWSTYSSILDTRAGQWPPTSYPGHGATFEFTDQIVGGWHSAFTMKGWTDGYALWQLIGGSTTSTHENLYFRSGVNSTWGSLRTILHSGNYNSYSPTLTGGSASGTWGINVTGNAATTSQRSFDYLKATSTLSNIAILAGFDESSRVYADAARNAIVINSHHYPALHLNACSSTNVNHGAYISMSGTLSAGGFRQWSMGVAGYDPAIFSIGYNDNMAGNGHYGTGDGWSSTDAHHGRLIVDTAGNTKIRGMLYVNGTSGGITTGSAVIHAGNIASQSVNYAATSGASSSCSGNAATASAAGSLTGPAYVNGGDGWFRSTGGCGWYNASYSVGIYSTAAGLVRTYNGASFLIEGTDLTIGTGTSSNIYMTDTDNTTRRIHCNSNLIGFLTSANAWGAYCDNAGNWTASNFSGTSSGTNTGDQTNISGFSATAAEATNNYFYVRGTSPSILLADTDQGQTRYLHHNGGSIGFLDASANWVLRTDPNGWTYGNFNGSLSGTATDASNVATTIQGNRAGLYNRGEPYGAPGANPIYDTGAMGRNTKNMNQTFEIGRSGFLDVWGDTDATGMPPGCSHVQGFQSMHYLYGHGLQIAGQYNQDIIYVRQISGTTYRSWRKIWDSATLTSVSQLSNDSGYITSSGTSAACSGNAATASSSVKFMSTSHAGSYWLVNNWTGVHWQITSNHSAGVRVAYADSAGSAPANGGTSAACSGNAATATYAYNCNGWFYINSNYGHSVVGAYESTVLQGVFAMGDSYKLTAGGAAGSLYGMCWSHPNAGGVAANLDSHGMIVLINGGFGSCMSYSIVASGNVTAYSDERLKRNWRDLDTDFVSQLADVRTGIYDRVDMRVNAEGGAIPVLTQVGVSAQSLRLVMPNAVLEANDDMKTLSVSYGNAALASCVMLARKAVNHEDRIRGLEAEIVWLKAA